MHKMKISTWTGPFQDSKATLTFTNIKDCTANMNTHCHINYVSSGLSTGQHGSYTGSSCVMGMHMDGHIWETVSQSTDQKLAGFWLQQASHVLVSQGEERRTHEQGVVKGLMENEMKNMCDIQYILY